jgi:hypothetical protein
VASVALDLQPFRDTPLGSYLYFLTQYEAMDPSFVAILMPLMPPLPLVA